MDQIFKSEMLAPKCLFPLKTNLDESNTFVYFAQWNEQMFLNLFQQTACVFSSGFKNKLITRFNISLSYKNLAEG